MFPGKESLLKRRQVFLMKPKLPTITHTTSTGPFKKSTQDAITRAVAAAATRIYLYFLSLDDTF